LISKSDIVEDEINISASEGTNISELKEIINEYAQKSVSRITDVLINSRHFQIAK
jgi:hypothetical protein